MKLYYTFLGKITADKIEDSITRAVREQPTWWKKLTAFVNDVRTPGEAVKKYSWHTILNYNTWMTAKGCPAIQNYMKQNIVLKFPCDVIIEVDENGGYRWRSANHQMSVSHHDGMQYPGFSDQYTVLKFCYNINFSVDKKVQLNFQDPIFYTWTDYRVSPGTVELNPKQAYGLNVIVVFPKNKARYFFKAGTVLCTAQFTDAIKTIEQKDLSKYKTNSDTKSFYMQNTNVF